jgi:hypothetical protein
MHATDYFDWPYAPRRDFFSDLAKQANLTLLSAANVDEGHTMPPGIHSLGQQTRDDYERLTGSVKGMLGIGSPLISPSVFTALCQATPVIMPSFTPDLRVQGWEPYAGYVQSVARRNTEAHDQAEPAWSRSENWRTICLHVLLPGLRGYARQSCSRTRYSDRPVYSTRHEGGIRG